MSENNRGWPHDLSRADLTRLAEFSAGSEIKNARKMTIDRTENMPSEHSISELHDFSFVDYIRSRLDEQEFKNRKFRILDMGGGKGAYYDELTEIFGAKIKVFTTGISKRKIRMKRGGEVPKEMAKWRTILELSHESKSHPGTPKEEFDLIVNTWGEWPWVLLNVDSPESLGLPKEQVAIYILDMMAAKLRSDGFASIFPVSYWWSDKQNKFLEQWRSKHPEIQLELVDGGSSRGAILRMKKNKPDLRAEP